MTHAAASVEAAPPPRSASGAGALARVGHVVLTVWVYALVLVFSATAIPLLTVFVTIVRVVTMSQRRALRRFRRAISWYGAVIVRVLPRPFIRATFEDEEPGAPAPGCVFVCNHPSASDPYLMAFLSFECVQVAKSWPLRLPVLGAFAKWAGYLSISELPVEEFNARGEALLREGVSIIAFPEGTRSGAGPIGPFHGAAFRLALHAGAPIVPVVIEGNEEIPARGSLLLRPGRVRVRKLAALAPDETRGMTPFEVKTLVRARLVAARARGLGGEHLATAGSA